MTEGVKTIVGLNDLSLFRREMPVHHVSEMILGGVGVLVKIGEVVLRKFKSESDENMKRVEDVGMERASEFLDFMNVLLNDVGVVTLMIAIKFGDVIDFNPVPDTPSKYTPASGPVPVVFAILQVRDVFGFLLKGQIVKLATKGILAVNLLLGNAKVDDVEESLSADSLEEGLGELLAAFRIVEFG